MDKLVHRFILLALGTVVLLTPAYSSTITANVLNPTDFSALIAGATTIDYSTLNPLTPANSQVATMSAQGLMINGVDFLGTKSNGTFVTYVQYWLNSAKDWGPLQHAIIGTDYSGYYSPTLVITLPSAVTALGINLVAVNSSGVAGGTLTVSLSNGASTTVDTPSWSSGTYSSPRAAGLTPAFLGLTSDTPFQSITISSLNGSQILTDYLQYGEAAAPAVPETSTWVMLGAGLAAIGLRRKWQHS